MKNIFLLSLAIIAVCSCSAPQSVEFITTTESAPWEMQPPVTAERAEGDFDLTIDTSSRQQIMEGFGTCFNELGWTALQRLDAYEREGILRELFAPGLGASFLICRMPIAANDFSLDWYSYNESDGDFEMTNFSIDNDRQTLIPFIKSALAHQPELRIWASPWSPPSWMKHNKHYASRSTAAMARRMAASGSTYMTKVVDNGLPENRQGYEGTDMFICKDPYYKAYALYFAKFIEAYRNEGIDIFAVMPQNEFNSAQIFPSCCWTAAGLARFIGTYLGPAMEEEGVQLMFGTMERPNEALVDTILTDPEAGRFINGIGFQWAGKEALPGIHKRYPDMKLYQTEQECGNGKNDWKGATYSWNLMKHYLNNGVSAYMYWNTALMEGGISRWGWAQNSLVVVNEDSSWSFTHEYYIMKHLSHYVVPGSVKLSTVGGYEDVLAFLNPDGSVVVAVANSGDTPLTLRMNINGTAYSPVLKPASISTIIFKALQIHIAL